MENQFIYGYRTITRLLKKRDNLVINPKKVYRIMKENGWLCRVHPKKVSNLGNPYYVTENKLDRDFKSEKPLEKLVTDMTYLYFGNCKLYLSSIMDLYNREIVAYTISDCQDTDFVLDTIHPTRIASRSALTQRSRLCLYLKSLLPGLHRKRHHPLYVPQGNTSG
ncbi:HTH-like domain protein [Streptococcus anginosus]|nr:HTH-like domain protein [Streptococcus anginosus]